jgi:WD40 repeat protein
MRSKRSIQTLEAPAPVCAVAFSAAGDQVYSAGLDNNITAWELRKGQAGLTLQGHADTVTGLRVSPEGNHLLSNCMDNTLRVWDMRPYAPANRCAGTTVQSCSCCWSTWSGSVLCPASRLIVLLHLLLACVASCPIGCHLQAAS